MRLLRLILFLIASIAITYSANAKRIKSSFKVTKDKEEMVSGTFMVASDCKDCNSGYQLDQVKIERYDKPAGSNFESFFVSNATDHSLRAITLYLTYTNAQGKMLHKRFLRLNCDVPPGETRRLEFKSWDTHRSFYYKGSVKPRKKADPYDVAIDPVALYLSFD